MASQNGTPGYGALVQPNYGSTSYTSAVGYSGYTGTYGVPGDYSAGTQHYASSGESAYGSGYGYPSQEQYPSPATYQQPTGGAYGAVGEPVAQSGSVGGSLSQTNFSSPPSQYNSSASQYNSSASQYNPPASQYNSPAVSQEQSWQSYGSTYGNNSTQYGAYSDNSGYSGKQDSSSGYSNSGSYSQQYSPRGRGFNRGRGGRGNRGGRGTSGHAGGNEAYRGRGRGRETFQDSGNGYNRGSSWRGTQARGTQGRGRGQYDGTRGRGRGWGQQNGMRGRGQDGMRGRGRGQDGMRGRGRGSDQGFNTNWKSGNKGGNITQQSCKVALEGDQNFISYKNSLQEFCQKLHKPVPQYTLVKADLGFSATVVVDDITYTCETSQREKKFAEVGAAFEALKGLGFIHATATYSAKGKKRPMSSNELGSPKSKASKSEPSAEFKSKLNEICQKMKIDSPSYSSVRTSGGFVCTVVLNGQVYQSTKPCGTKKIAEQEAAQVVLGQLDFSDQANTSEGANAVITPITGTPSSATESNTITSPTLTTDTPSFSGTPGIRTTPQKATPVKSMKNILQEYCQKNSMAIPVYSSVKDAGMNIATVTVNSVDYVGTPHVMKKPAEQNAAKKAVEELGIK